MGLQCKNEKDRADIRPFPDEPSGTEQGKWRYATGPLWVQSQHRGLVCRSASSHKQIGVMSTLFLATLRSANNDTEERTTESGVGRTRITAGTNREVFSMDKLRSPLASPVKRRRF